MRKIEEIEAKKAQYLNEVKDLKNRKKTADRKRRTHLLCCAGAELAAIFDHVLEKDEIKILGDLIRGKLESGEFSDLKIVPEKESEIDNEQSGLPTDVFDIDNILLF